MRKSASEHVESAFLKLRYRLFTFSPIHIYFNMTCLYSLSLVCIQRTMSADCKSELSCSLFPTAVLCVVREILQKWVEHGNLYMAERSSIDLDRGTICATHINLNFVIRVSHQEENTFSMRVSEVDCFLKSVFLCWLLLPS